MNYFFIVYPALSIISFLFIFIFPAGAPLFLFISFISLLWYMEEDGRSNITDVGASAIIILATFLTPLNSVYFIPIVIIPLLILFYSRKRSWPVFFPILVAPLPLTMITAGLLIFSPEFKEALTAQALEYINILAKEMSNGAERLDVTGFMAFIFIDKARGASTLVNLIPGISYATVAALVYIADKAKPFFDDKNNVIHRDYRLPDFFVWLVIAGGALLLINNYGVKFTSYNLIIIFATIYFLQGIQLLGIMFDRFKLSRFIRMLVYVFVAIEPHLLLLLSFFGLFSIWFLPKIFIRQAEGDKKDGGI